MTRKVWVSSRQLGEITSLIGESMGDSSLRKTDELVGVHNELAVARSRFNRCTEKPNAIRVALGRDSTDVPLSLEVEEILLLMELFESDLPRDLTQSLREAL